MKLVCPEWFVIEPSQVQLFLADNLNHRCSLITEALSL